VARRRSRFDTFCREAFDFLEQSGVRYLVIGGLAVVAVGEPRTTGDVDVIGFVAEEDAHRLIEQARRAGFQVDVETERRRLRETGTLRFRREPFQLDVITASMPFEEDAFRRATPHRMFGRALRFPSPEDLILFKVLAGRDKDMLDAIGVARRHAAALDRPYLEAALRPICDLAEDMSAWHRLQDVLRKAAPTPPV
jgi:hypothetical protein